MYNAPSITPNVTHESPKVNSVDQRVAKLEQQVKELMQQVVFLERENNRRRNDVAHVAQKFSKKE